MNPVIFSFNFHQKQHTMTSGGCLRVPHQGQMILAHVGQLPEKVDHFHATFVLCTDHHMHVEYGDADSFH